MIVAVTELVTVVVFGRVVAQTVAVVAGAHALVSLLGSAIPSASS